MTITNEKPEGIYCEDIRVFGESKSCPSLDQSQGARNPFCTELKVKLGWNIAGHILKECKEGE